MCGRAHVARIDYPEYATNFGCKCEHEWVDWRDVPLLTALSHGVASVEADVYLINGSLFVSSPAAFSIRSAENPVNL